MQTISFFVEICYKNRTRGLLYRILHTKENKTRKFIKKVLTYPNHFYLMWSALTGEVSHSWRMELKEICGRGKILDYWNYIVSNWHNDNRTEFGYYPSIFVNCQHPRIVRDRESTRRGVTSDGCRKVWLVTGMVYPTIHKTTTEVQNGHSYIRFYHIISRDIFPFNCLSRIHERYTVYVGIIGSNKIFRIFHRILLTDIVWW